MRRLGWCGALIACGAPPADPAALVPPVGPSVVLITLDTTRADRMSAYGRPGAVDTPSFDAVAASGALFLRAVSSAPLTIPSHSTMLTGRFPPSHGVRDNGNHVLPPSAVTLSERFQAAGYATAAFTAAFPTSRRWGFDQGFDVYSDAMRRDPSVQDWRDERPAGEVVDEALAWLADTDGPVFVWVHLFDAHWPYAPPEPHRSRYAGRGYDGEIAYADAEVGRLLAALRGEAVVAITADHGEGLGEGGEATHGFLLHDATLWVPLALSGPGVPAGLRVETPVSHVDLAPTLLTLAGLPVHAEVQGRDLLLGGTPAVFSEATTGRTSMGLSDLTALTVAAGRVTRGAWSGWYPYDAAAGRVGVEPTRGPEVEPHLAALARLEGELEVVDAEAPVGDDVTGLLEAMGYVAGDPHAAAGDVDPRDVISLLPATWEVRRRIGAGDLAGARAGLARLEGELAGTAVLEQITVDLLVAEGAVEEAASRSLGQAALRDTAEAWRRAGEVAMQAGWLREARDAFVLALDAVPTDARSMVGLVRATVLLDGADAAGPLTDAFLQVFPTLDELHLVAAERDLATLQLADARRHVDAVLSRAPLDVWALHLDARVSWALGEPERAIERLLDARRELPRALDVRLLLTSYLIEVGRVAEALRTIRPAAAELPDDPDVVAALARAEAAWAALRRR